MKRAIGWLGVIGLGAGAVYLLAPEASRRVAGRRPSPRRDMALAEQVKLRLPRYLARPEAVKVAIDDGRVVLTGEAHDREVDDMVAAIARLSGVRAVDDRLSLQR